MSESSPQQRHGSFAPVSTLEESESASAAASETENGGRSRRILRVVALGCLAVLAALLLILRQRDAFQPTENHTNKSLDHNGNAALDNLLRQKVWTGSEIAALLDEPKCAEAIRRAKQRQPTFAVALCPLCTRGSLNKNSTTRVQYLKVAKAGSSTMVKLLTKQDQGSTPLARHLCAGQPQRDFRFTLVRHPLDRVISAYREVDIGAWKHSNVTYRNEHSEPSRILQFLDDFFSGRMASFDAGMPHHLFSAAITLDAARQDDRLPQLVGRLEEMPTFIAALNQQVPGGANLSIPNVTYARRPHAIPQASNVIYSLFEEDFVCFGYPYVQNKSAVSISSDKLNSYQQNYDRKNPSAAPNCTVRYTLEPSP